LVFVLFACGKGDPSGENINEKPNIVNDTKQIDEFKVSIHVENGGKDLDVYATITYLGNEAEKEIYHGESIFFFNVYQQDGDFEYIGGMEQPLLTTTLIQNKPHKVNLNLTPKVKLNPGTYVFEAISEFSLDSDDVLGTKIEIPVSKMEQID
jgi:hypothetical protein